MKNETQKSISVNIKLLIFLTGIPFTKTNVKYIYKSTRFLHELIASSITTQHTSQIPINIISMLVIPVTDKDRQYLKF